MCLMVILQLTMTEAMKKCENVSDTLEEEIQSVVRMLSNRTGFAVSVGYVDVRSSPTPLRTHTTHNTRTKQACGREIEAAAGSRNIPETSSSTTVKDRYTYGSGTKGLTATAVMRLVDRNVLTLEDPAFRYIDRALQEFGTTMVDTLGTRAADVTVGQLIQMRSGISDFDVPDFDNFVLKNSNRTYSPLDFLSYVSSLKDEICEADYAGNCKCRYQFIPGTYVIQIKKKNTHSNPRNAQTTGTQVAYSSTNFVLAGLVLVGAQQNVTSWKDYDMARQGLGFNDNSFVFLTDGPLNRSLDVGGTSVQYGETIVYVVFECAKRARI